MRKKYKKELEMRSTINNTLEEKYIIHAVLPRQKNTTKIIQSALKVTAASILAPEKTINNEGTDIEIVLIFRTVAAAVENAKIDTKLDRLKKNIGTPTTGAELKTNA
jgi:hypothetical protein